MPTSSSAAFCCMLCRRASIASATTVSSPIAPAVIASLSVVGCSKPLPRVPSTSLPTIPPKAIARSPLLTSPSVLIAVAPCGGSHSCHAPATLSHSPATRHDAPTDTHGDRAWSQSCAQRCQHRHRAADQSFQSAMPTVPALEIDATTAHRPRSPVPRANKPISARTLQPRLNVKPQQAFATFPIAPHLPRLRSIRLLWGRAHARVPGAVVPRDLTEPSRFPNRSRHDSRWQTEGVCHGPRYCGADGLHRRRGSPFCPASDAAQARRLLAIAAVLDGASREEAATIGGMDRQTLRDWVIRFNEQGADGLINIPSPGVPPKLNSRHKAFLARIVEEGPIPAIHGVVRWRACDLIMRRYEEFGLSVSDDTIYRALKKLGFSHMSARPKAYKQNAEAMDAFKKTSPSVRRKSGRSLHPAHR